MSKTATTMKLSKKTLDILKNFSSINASLFTKKGDKLYTVARSQTICAEAQIDETFDDNFCIYDLSRFLGVISLFENPEFEFEQKYVTISGNNNSSIKYHFCEEALLDFYSKNYGKCPKKSKVTYKFDVTSKQIDNLKRAASLLELNVIEISKSTQGGIDISAVHDDGVTQNVFNVNIPDGVVLEENSKPAYVDISLLNLYPGKYKVEVDELAIKWSNADTDLTYYIAKKQVKD